MTDSPPRRSRAATIALYTTIGTLVSTALLGGYFIIVGDQAAVAARAWLTLLLVAAFAGAVCLDASVGSGPNRWYLAASTMVNVFLVAVGLLKLWNGWLQPANTDDGWVWSEQFLRFIGIAIVLRAALLLIQVYCFHFVTRARGRIERISALATIALVAATVAVVTLPLACPELDWPGWWWRTAAATMLAALVCVMIPVIVRAFEPKPERPAAAAPGVRAARNRDGLEETIQPQFPPVYGRR